MLNTLKEIFASFQRHDVRYVVIGGIAAILHGVPRATFDLDILIEPTAGNAQRLLDALSESGFGTASLTSATDLLATEITVFKDKVRIDVQTSTPGLTFYSAWQHRKSLTYDRQDFYIISKEDLIASKTASGRPVDLEDVRLLQAGDSKKNE